METLKYILIIVIFVAIAMPFVLLKLFIKRKINEGIDNVANKASAKIRNKKYQQQGQQSLADRYKQNSLQNKK